MTQTALMKHVLTYTSHYSARHDTRFLSTALFTGSVDREAWTSLTGGRERRLQPGRPPSSLQLSFLASKPAWLPSQCFTINKTGSIKQFLNHPVFSILNGFQVSP